MRDINPEGLAEQWKHTFNISFGGGESAAAVASTSKDGKSVVASTPSEPKTITIDVFANFGPVCLRRRKPRESVGPRRRAASSANRRLLLGWQMGAKFNFTKNLYFQLAPTIYNYTGSRRHL